jgi:DNA-binding NarL/FixJ family response regulator
MSTPIRIAIVDDQALVRLGLKALLSSFKHVSVVIDIDSAQGLIAALSDSFIDVILSDIRMPAMDGFALIKKLREMNIQTPVILLTTFDESNFPLLAADAGAQGFLLKDASPEDLLDAIERVAKGETLFAPVSTNTVRAHYAYRDTVAPTDTFNDREISILRLLAGGYSNKEIAKTVFLSEGTVKNYVSDILDKLGTRDRTRAVLKAITLRII